MIAFAVLVWRAFVIATESQDRFGSLVRSGSASFSDFSAS